MGSELLNLTHSVADLIQEFEGGLEDSKKGPLSDK